jgi:magnesium transporter
VETVTRQVWPLEQRVTSGHLGDPRSSWRSCSGPAMGCWRYPTWPPWATSSPSGWRRWAASSLPIASRWWPTWRTSSPGVADGQIRYLEGVIEFYKARFPHLAVVVAAMLVISAVLLRWAKRQGWW